MEVAWVVSMVCITVAVVFFFSFLLIRRYNDPRDSNHVTVTVCVFSVSIVVFCSLLIPIDIYSVSSSLTSDGHQTDPELVHSTKNALKYLYYSFYILMLAFAFGIMPFAYFYFEEDGEDVTVKERACGALKYTAGFIIVFGILLACGLVVKRDKFDADHTWVQKLNDGFGAGDAVLAFTVGCLSVLGLMGWVTYTAYGLSGLPVELMRQRDSDATKQETLPFRSASATDRLYSQTDEELRLELRRNHENMSYISSRYDIAGRDWTTDDRRRYRELEREKKQIELILKQRQEKVQGTNVKDRCHQCWNALVIVRFAVGLPLLGLSLLLIISMFISMVDKFQHSDCGPKCGYAITQSNLPNPVDMALNFFSRFFPFDFILFALLVVYIIVCSFSGLVSLGVRLLVWKLYSINRRRTPAHALLFGCWLLMFVVLVLNMQILNLTPQYATFGNQFYYALDNTTMTMVQHPCNMDISGLYPDNDLCVMSAISTFINSISIEMPWFSVILFFANLVFLSFYLIFFIYLLATSHDSFYKKVVNDPDLLED